MTTFITKLQGAEFRVQRLHDTPYGATTLDQPQLVVDYLRPQLETSLVFRRDVENLIVVHLSCRLKPIGFEIISHGTIDTLLCHPREVFKSAIVTNASAIIISHNHPSGDPTPSPNDIQTTQKLRRAGDILQIAIRDHIILGQPAPQNPKGWASLHELGFF